MYRDNLLNGCPVIQRRRYNHFVENRNEKSMATTHGVKEILDGLRGVGELVKPKEIQASFNFCQRLKSSQLVDGRRSVFINARGASRRVHLHDAVQLETSSCQNNARVDTRFQINEWSQDGSLASGFRTQRSKVLWSHEDLSFI